MIKKTPDDSSYRQRRIHKYNERRKEQRDALVDRCRYNTDLFSFAERFGALHGAELLNALDDILKLSTYSIGMRLIKFLDHWSADVIINTLCIIRYWKMYWLVGLYNSMYKLFSHVNPDVVVEAIKLLTVGRDSMGIYGVTELNKMILTRCYDDKPIQDRAVYYMSCYRSTFTSLYFECIETMLDTLENSSLDVMRNALWVLDKMLEKKEDSALKVLTILEGEKILLRAWAGACRSLAGELLEKCFGFKDPFLERLENSIDDLVLSDITFTCIK
jgi:hypothetical protein